MFLYSISFIFKDLKVFLDKDKCVLFLLYLYLEFYRDFFYLF